MRGKDGAREEELQRAVERAPQAMWCVGADGRVVWANAAARRLLDAEEVEGQLLCTLLEDEASCDRLEALRLEEGAREQTLPWTDGRHLRVTAYPVHEDVEAPRYVYTAVDVARQHEPVLSEIDERMRALIDQPLVGFYIIQDGRFMYVNEMIEQLTGYSREELTAPSFQLIDLVVEDDREVVRENMRKRLTGQERAMRYTVRFQHKDGHIAYVEVHGMQSRYRGRAAISGVVVDLSNQQRATANLKALLDSSPQGFVLLDRDLHVLSYNTRAHRMVQQFQQVDLRRSEPGDKYILPEQHASFRQHAMRALIGEVVQNEQKFQDAQGAFHWIEIGYAPVIEHGHTIGICISLYDVTTRKEAELELQSREHRLRQQNEVMLDLTHQHATQKLEVDEVVRFINEKVAKTLDVAASAVWCFEGQRARCSDFYDREAGLHERRPALSLDSLNAYLETLSEHRAVSFRNLEEDPRFEHLHGYIQSRDITSVLHAPIRQDQQVIGVLALEHRHTSRTWRADEQQFLSSAADFIALALEARQRRRMQEALQEAYQRLELHIQNSPLAFIDVDDEFRVRRWSQRAEELFGYSSEETIGKTVIENLKLTHPDDVDYVYEQVQSWLDSGEPTTVIHNRNITRDGRELHCKWYNSVIRADDGKLIALISLVQDVTAQIEHERELVAAKEEAEEMNRLKTAFLANMSHEVRTPLTAIIGFADVLAEEVDEVHRELVGFIRHGGTRLMETLNSVLNLAQLEGRAFHLEPIWFDLVTFAEDRLALFRLQAEQRGLDLRLHVPDDRPIDVRLDVSALGRVLANLVSNALKFTAEGSVTVEVAQMGAEVELRVVDTGEGIDVSFLPHVFDEFRQESSGTARRYEGSGLGLAISRRLVELMDGTIAVESVKGEGTTFIVRLPRVMPDDQDDEEKT